MNNIIFPSREVCPAPMPEVLTETQQRFANFVIRNTKLTDIKYFDAFDIYTGELNCMADGLIPIDKVSITSMTVVEDSSGLLATPYIHRSIKLEALGANLQELSFNSLHGWTVGFSEGDSTSVNDEYVSRVVRSLESLKASN